MRISHSSLLSAFATDVLALWAVAIASSDERSGRKAVLLASRLSRSSLPKHKRTRVHCGGGWGLHCPADIPCFAWSLEILPDYCHRPIHILFVQIDYKKVRHGRVRQQTGELHGISGCGVFKFNPLNPEIKPDFAGMVTGHRRRNRHLVCTKADVITRLVRQMQTSNRRVQWQSNGIEWQHRKRGGCRY